MRSALLAVVLVAVVLIPAPRASAKGIDYAHFSGPGLHSGGVTINHGDPRDLWHTGLLEAKGNALASLGLTRRDLGAAYHAEYRMDYAPRATLRQVIYPYAKRGPITFTPRGQHLGQDYESFRGGWYASNPNLLGYLIAHGFPSSDPTADVNGPVPQKAPPSKRAAPIAWVWEIGAAVLTALVAMSLLMRRRRMSA